MNYVVAVSGGVDSVVLLDMLAKSLQGQSLLQGLSLQRGDKLVVAHFDHGIREDSAADARFVEALAFYYALPFETERVELGTNASEDIARKHRYTFLRRVAKRHDARIVTAHHLDDMVETIVINLRRGTGWRGLAVLNADDTERPLMGMTKQAIYVYALKYNLEWVEDESNREARYLRNRVRFLTTSLSKEDKEKLYALRLLQTNIANKIATETTALQDVWGNKRYPFVMLKQPEAIELLRAYTQQQLTRPQLLLLWNAIKTAKPATQVNNNLRVNTQFSLDEFKVSVL
jgi:tRNA(Ile)-lysidine synthase